MDPESNVLPDLPGWVQRNAKIRPESSGDASVSLESRSFSKLANGLSTHLTKMSLPHQRKFMVCGFAVDVAFPGVSNALACSLCVLLLLFFVVLL